MSDQLLSRSNLKLYRIANAEPIHEEQYNHAEFISLLIEMSKIQKIINTLLRPFTSIFRVAAKMYNMYELSRVLAKCK